MALANYALRYICQNAECLCLIEVLQSPASEAANFHCRCGSVMKQVYVAPEVKKVSLKDARATGDENLFKKCTAPRKSEREA
jgi:hypothetical protein